jgi:RNA polymerase sigma-70 factor (ECF subfamily)
LTEPEAARDLAADVFRLAWERAVGPGGSMPSSGWLFVTARNVLANARRKSAREERGRAAIVGGVSRDPVPGATPGPDHYPADPHGRVTGALAALAEPHREVLMAHYWDGMTASECARLLGCSTPAAWTRLSRARAAFRHAYTTLEVQQ